MAGEILAAVLGGAVKGVAATATRAALAPLVSKLQTAILGAPPTAWDQAVKAALAKAARHVEESADLGSGTVRKRVAILLSYQETAEEISRAALFGEKWNLDRLSVIYRRIAEADEATVSEDEAIQAELALEPCLELVVSELKRDSAVGGLIALARQIASAARLESAAVLTNELLTKIEQSAGRTAAANEAASETLRQVEGHTRAAAETQGAILAESRRGRPAGFKPTEAEKRYLTWLLSQCDDVPLMGEKRALPGERRGEGETSLRKIYVTLATKWGPTWNLVCDRLELASGQREALRSAVQELVPEPAAGKEAGKAAVDLGADDEPLLAALRRVDAAFLKKRPDLLTLVASPERLRQALEPWTSWEALAKERTSVLLGRPGSGKSSLVQRLAAHAAASRLGRPETGPESEERTSIVDCFPVRIVVRPWGARAVKDSTPQERLLQLAFETQATQVGWEAWQERLHLPGTLVIFDGLDEVPGHEGDPTAEDTSMRRRLVRAIEELAGTYQNVSVLVSCRTRPFLRKPPYFPSFSVIELAPLDAPRIATFCRGWYAEMKRIGQCKDESEAKSLGNQLLAALRDERREKLREMAETPLLLTMLAKVNLKEQLPEGRLGLYALCVRQLLWEWEKHKSAAEEAGEKSETLDRLLAQAPNPLQQDVVEKVLWKLAWEVHGAARDGVADLSAEKLRGALASLAPPGASDDQHGHWYAWSRRVVKYLKRRDGLLVYLDDEVFTFPHRTFQEYLAARWMRQDSARRVELLAKAGREGWDEVVRLACLQLASESRGDGLDLMKFLASHDDSAPTTAAGVRRALVWGHAALDLKLDESETLATPDAKTKAELLQVLEERLTTLLQDSSLLAARRLEAGEILSDLGLRPPDLDKLVEIPDRGLGYSFVIGKYPVTNFEYRKFVEAGGYERDRPWWSEQAKKEIESWRNWPSAPAWWDDPKWNRDTFPVVGVSWYEALAYCAWLEEQRRQDGKLEAGRIVTLPTAEEWAAATNGPGSGTYPWGDGEDASRLNCKESGFGRTTPAHLHPAQCQEPELFDLVGNAWEWTVDPDQSYKGAFVLVGGAYWTNLENATSAARFRYSPWFRYYFIGFRVVLVPSSRRSSES